MTIIIPLANGFEEIEAVNLIDILRRANFNVKVASIDENKSVIGAHNISINTDCFISSIKANNIHMIILPGGWGGTKLLAKNHYIQELLKEMNNNNQIIAAICAAPYALNTAGVLSHKYTCYPSVQNDIRVEGYNKDKNIVEENNIFTSKGPATAMCFALYIVKKFKGKKVYTEVKNALLVDKC